MPAGAVRSCLLAVSIPFLFCMVSSSFAAGALQGRAAGALTPVPPAMPAAGLVLRGTLGADQIQMTLRSKPEDDGGIEGDYFIFGQGTNILLAGEIDVDGLWMEESINGKDVSGQWEGQRQGEVIQGAWRPVDDSPGKQFSLRIVRTPAPVLPPATRATGSTPR